MTDGVPKNTGNAYLIKGASLPDSYAAFKAAIEAGTQGLDLNFNSAGWQVIGSLLSKANLLSDATAAKYFASVTGTETVDQALSKLGAVALINENGLTSVLGTAFKQLKIETVSYSGSNTYGISNPTVVTFSATPKIVFFVPLLTDDIPWGIAFTDILSSSYQDEGYALFHKSAYYMGFYTEFYAKLVDKTLSIYCQSSDWQFNRSGVSYKAIAIVEG